MQITRMHRPAAVLSATLALLLIPAISGCKSTATAPDAGTQQNAATPDGTQAGAPGSGPAAGPAGAGQAAPGSRAASGPPAPPRPTKVTLTVDPGKDVTVRINETINSRTANVGDPFTGMLTSALTTRTGDIVFPKGTEVSGSVVAAKGQGRFAGSGVLAIALSEVGGHPVVANEYVVSQKGKGKRSAALIGGGAGAGALIGGLAGGGKGALIGGLLGGGAGTAGAAYTGNKPLVIPTESIVVFELTQPLSNTVVQ